MKPIKAWSSPKNVREVRSFYGFVSFYMRFLKDFSTLTPPLNEIVKKYILFLNGVKNKRKHLFSLRKIKLKHSFLSYLTFINLLKLNVMHLMWQFELFIAGRIFNCLF